MRILTKTAKETQKIAKILAGEILSFQNNRKKALVIALNGELGAGKTTFTQGFVAGLGVREYITSPTFVLMHEHKLSFKPQTSRFKKLYHLDCYRLKNEKDLIDLDIKEIFANPENIVLIEWEEKVKKILPKETIKINFKYINKNEREIDIKF